MILPYWKVYGKQFLLNCFCDNSIVLQSTENQMDHYLSKVLVVSHAFFPVGMLFVYYLLLLIKLILLKLIMPLCKEKYLILQGFVTSTLLLL